MRRPSSTTAAFALFVASAAPLRAQLQRAGPEFLVNTYTTDNQGRMNVACDSSGGFTVAWLSYAQDYGGAGIHAQRYDASGSPKGGEIGVSALGTEGSLPDVAALPGGAFVVVWTTSYQDGDLTGTYARRYAASGAPVDEGFRVNTYTTGGQSQPRVAADAAGDFVVVWGGASGDDDAGIHGQRFAASGAPLGGEFRVNTYTTGNQQVPGVAMNPTDGSFVVVWNDQGHQYGVSSVKGQRYAPSGEPVGGEFRVNTTTGRAYGAGGVAVDSTGAFVVVWGSGYSFTPPLFGQRFGSDGSLLGAEISVATTSGGGFPRVAYDPTGGFTVAWGGAFTSGVSDILAQRYAADGSPSGSTFRVSSYTNSANGPAVIASAPGRFVVAWRSYKQDGSKGGVYAQRFTLGCLPGDVNGDGSVGVADVFWLINALFASGPAPVCSGDVNGDTFTNVGDVFWLINFLFAGGPPPK
jgi:hypothetical protein